MLSKVIPIRSVLRLNRGLNRIAEVLPDRRPIFAARFQAADGPQHAERGGEGQRASQENLRASSGRAGACSFDDFCVRQWENRVLLKF